jgi:hypothetical protein
MSGSTSPDRSRYWALLEGRFVDSPPLLFDHDSDAR